MASIAESARIIQDGKVKSVKALAAVVTITCAATTCTEVVTKAGNFCSMTCALTPAPVEPTPEPVLTPEQAYFRRCEGADWFFQYSDDASVWRRGKAEVEAIEADAKTSPMHQAIYDAWRAYIANINTAQRPTLDAITPKEEPIVAVIEPTDAGDQAKALVANHLLWHVAQDQRVKHSAAAHLALKALLEDPTYATADAQDLFDLVLATYSEYLPFAQAVAHVQAPKAALTTTTKTVRKPRTAKHQPRTTDNKEHPVTEKITMTKAEMERAISKAAEALVREREATIKATPVVAPEDKPVEIVAKKGGRKKIERATAKDREFIGTVLPAIVVNENLTIPALEMGEESIDTIAPPKVRSPYNKARYRLDKTPTPLDKDTTTYRSLMAEHLRIQTLVGTAPKAKKVKVAAAVAPTAKAKKVSKKAKALMEILGCTEEQALAALSK